MRNLNNVNIDKLMGEEYLRDEREHLKSVNTRIGIRKDICAQEKREFDINEKIMILEDNVDIVSRMITTQMKSKVQTYDIRDSDEYKGVLDIEVLI